MITPRKIAVEYLCVFYNMIPTHMCTHHRSRLYLSLQLKNNTLAGRFQRDFYILSI